MIAILMMMANASSQSLTPTTVGTIIGAVLVALLGGGLLGKKVGETQKVTLDPSPLEVDMKEKFVTRREFERHERDVLNHLSEIKSALSGTTTKMESLFERTMDAMETRDKATSAKIEAVASGAYRGRQKLWEQTNANRENTAALMATSDVANQIGKLAEAIQPPVCAKKTEGKQS